MLPLTWKEESRSHKKKPTCPLENGAPSTATDWALLCWQVWLSWVRRRRNRGPRKAMFLFWNLNWLSPNQTAAFENQKYYWSSVRSCARQYVAALLLGEALWLHHLLNIHELVNRMTKIAWLAHPNVFIETKCFFEYVEMSNDAKRECYNALTLP